MYLKRISAKSIGVVINNIEFFFSYDTLVGVKHLRTGEVLCKQNYWGPTTGRLLNQIERDKTKRLTEDEFAVAIEGLLNKQSKNALINEIYEDLHIRGVISGS